MLSPEQIEAQKAQALLRSGKLGVQDELRLQKLLNNYKLTPMTLAMKLNPAIIPARHLMYISTVVAAAIARGNGRVIISLPPRHGKSELITKNVPIWTLENYGQRNVILCSYGGDLSTDFGRKVRDLIKDNESLLDIRIRPDAERTNNWLTNQGGAMYSVGLGGPITGRGADVLIIDDYIKEIKESLSQNQRDYIWDWFVTTAYTRLEPNASVIIVATRWHHDDLIGRILKHKPGKHPWTNIVIPAIAEAGDVLNRPIGTPLFEERFGLEELNDRKTTLGSYFFNALYQQRPENDFGQLTNRAWIKILPRCPNLDEFEVARIWDLAATEEGGDWAVGTLLAYHKRLDITVIADVQRVQLSPLGVETVLARTALMDGPKIPIYIEREPGSSGKLLISNYSQTILKGYTVHEGPANDKKLVRTQPFLAAAEARKVYLVGAEWNELWLQEYDDYPGGDHDDQMDTAGMGYSILSGKKLRRIAWGKDADSSKTSTNTASSGNRPVMERSTDGDTIILPNGKTYSIANTSGIPSQHSSHQDVSQASFAVGGSSIAWGKSADASNPKKSGSGFGQR